MFMGDHFGYPSGVAHGVTAYVLNVLPALVRAGVDLTVCFMREPHPAAEALSQCGIRPIFLSAAASDPRVVWRVAAIARANGCRIFHAGGLKATLAARIVARARGGRAILHLHDRNWPSLWLGGLQRLFSSQSDIGICVAAAVSDVAEQGYHLRRERLRVIPNAIDLAKIRGVDSGARGRVRESMGLGATTPVLAMIGRMYQVKGQRAMVEILALVSKHRPDVVLLFVGDGPDRAMIEARIDELGLRRNVRFLGHRGDVPEILRAADLTLMPSESEGLPIAAIESMAAGCPVVGFDVGGMREVITDGQDGCVVAARDNQAFASTVLSLLAAPSRLAELGRRAAIAVDRFGVEQHLRDLLSCYHEAASDLAKSRVA